MKIWLVVISVGLIVFLAGCAKEKPTEVQFKNDVITIENLVVENLAPYSGTTTSIEFDIQNNGDKRVKELILNFFDLPGFVPESLDCGVVTTRQGGTCEFRGTESLESLESRHVAITLKADRVESPTPFKISFSISYAYSGSREAVIPIVDGQVKKEPSFKFSQSEPSVGPIIFDIQPLLEREKKIDNVQIKEYWGVKDRNFVTKFVLRDVGKVEGVIKSINIPPGNVEFKELINLNRNSCEHFDGSGKSKISVNKTFNTLICLFTPKGTQIEFTSIIKLNFIYNYEFIRSVNFVVQPPLR